MIQPCLLCEQVHHHTPGCPAWSAECEECAGAAVGQFHDITKGRWRTLCRPCAVVWATRLSWRSAAVQ